MWRRWATLPDPFHLWSHWVEEVEVCVSLWFQVRVQSVCVCLVTFEYKRRQRRCSWDMCFLLWQSLCIRIFYKLDIRSRWQQPARFFWGIFKVIPQCWFEFLFQGIEMASDRKMKRKKHERWDFPSHGNRQFAHDIHCKTGMEKREFDQGWTFGRHWIHTQTTFSYWS